MPDEPRSDETRAALKGLLDAFRQADIERLAHYYHEAIDWQFHAPPSIFPFAGIRRNRSDVMAGFRELFSGFRFTDYRTDALLVDGDRAATLGEATIVQVSTGRVIRLRTGNFYLFRHGQVVEYRGFTDSFDVVEQVLGRELDL